MDHRIDGAEGTIAMATESEPATVDQPAPIEFIDDCGEVVPQIMDIEVIHPPTRADDRRIGLDHHITRLGHGIARARPGPWDPVLVEGPPPVGVGRRARLLAHEAPDQPGHALNWAKLARAEHARRALEPDHP